MAAQGRIPKELHKAEVPFGPTCAFSKATKGPCKYKANKQRPIKSADHLGECVLVDSLESLTAGFIAQIKGY